MGLQKSFADEAQGRRLMPCALPPISKKNNGGQKPAT
jgi:hypothetical protein